VRAGEVLVTPRGVHHEMRNDGPEPASTLHVYAPPTGRPVSPPFIDRTEVPTDTRTDTRTDIRPDI
jgi:oxalate decarboxylase/phosphoglucose isomerase-like protein (cupin superfamily)